MSIDSLQLYIAKNVADGVLHEVYKTFRNFFTAQWLSDISGEWYRRFTTNNKIINRSLCVNILTKYSCAIVFHFPPRCIPVSNCK